MRKMYSVLPLGRVVIAILFAIIVLPGFSQSTVLISPTGDGGFETGATFAANGWTVVNGATNQWFVGAVSTPSAGTSAAYISDNATGTTHNFNNGASSTVHFYRDISFPAGQTDISLSFKWKAQGEGSYDYITVFSIPTSQTPVVNSPAAGFQSWLNIPTSYPGAVIHATPVNLNLQGTYQTQNICLPASYAGTTRRLVFMWTNDNSAGTQPPGSVDEISLISATPNPPAAQPTALNLTPISTSQIDGTFTGAAGSPSYLVVAYPTGATPVAPVNGTSYSVGSTLGTGTVVYTGNTAAFNATGLSGSTTYDFYIYSYTALACTGNQYLTASPLTGTASTNPCGGLSGGTYSVGPTGTYLTLTDAIAATAIGMTGPVIFELQNTYNSGGETFPIVFGYNACVGPLNQITVRPAATAVGLSISGDNAVAILDLNGGDYITIDGRPGGVGTTSQLSVVNINTTGVTVRFTNDAKNNTLRYLDIQGSNNVTPTTATLAGVVYFAGAGADATGNDNNTIANSLIHAASGGNPAVGVYGFGTNTTVASYNDNNTITNCEIFDFFKAGTASTGLKLDAGNNAWTITNNHFYQTAPLTYTAAATHRAIWVTPNTASINNTASGFTISGNFIGGSGASLAAPAYTMSGSFNYAFMGMDISVGLGTASSIQNNVIGNISMTASATATNALVGINIANGNVNAGTVTGNTIGSLTTTGDILFTTGANSGGVMGVRVGGGGTVNIANNKIGGIDLNGSAATFTANFNGINVAGGTTVSVTNNTVGSPSVANSINMVNATTSATAAVMNGINISGAAATITTVNGNTIANINSNTLYTGTGAASVRGIIATTSATSINNNIVRNLSSSSASTGTGANGAIVGIAMSSTNVAGANVTGNIIDSLVLTTSNATAAIQATGIFYSGTTTVTNTISKNFIHSFDFANANPNIIFTGIDNAAGANNYINNMIRLGVKPDGTDLINDNTIRGISSNSTAATNIYFNSIYIGGSNVGSNVKNTYAFIRTSTTGTYDIRNNILVNNRSNAGAGAGGKHYVFVFTNPASGSATAGVTINNNLYQYNGNDGTFAGYTGTTPPADVTTFVAGWLASDAASVVGNPQFIAPNGTASTVNLHIHPTNPTPIEGGGANIVLVTDDFDGETRSGLTPVDIGADAGNFVILDIAPPVITYTPLTASCNTADRTFQATITDGGGMPVAGGNVPRIYYKKSTAGAWINAAGTFISGNGNSSVWEFTITSASIPGGVNNLDMIEYFIIAQDNAGNVGSMPGGVAATNVNGPITTYPTPNTYAIASLSGSYDVGGASSAPFNTLTSALAFYSSACLTGAVTYNLIDPAYDGTTETFPIIINANATASAVNTLTIKPSTGNIVNIEGSVASNSLIRFNAAKYITIDGSNNGTTTQDLTIRNTNVTSPSVISIMSNGTAAGSGFITIKNNIITTTAVNQAGNGVSVGGTTPGSAGADNDNITIQNNAVTNVANGVYAIGTAAGLLDNLVITGNSFTALTTVSGPAAIRAGQATGSTISVNTVNMQTSGTTPVGISLETGYVSSTVTRNLITKVVSTNTGGYAGRGITIGTGTATSDLTISNNMIYGINGSNWTSFGNSSTMGILIGEVGSGTGLTATAGGIRLYYNSVNLAGTYDRTGANVTTALYVGTGASALDIRNNIFVNSMMNSNAAGTASKAYAIYSAAPNTVFANINYNDYYVSGAQGVLAYITSDRANLAALVTGFGQNANSLNIDPLFVTNDDLHLQISSSMDGAATPVSVTIDFDADVRNGTTPDIGADEFSPPACTGAVGGDASAPTVTYCGTGTPAITATGFSVGTGSTYQWQQSNDNFATNVVDIAGQTFAATLTLPAAVTTTTNYRLKVTCTSGIATAYSDTITITINPKPTITITPVGSTTICAGSSITLNASGTSNTYSWAPAATLNQSTGASVIASPATSTTYTVTGTITATGCTETANILITIPQDFTVTASATPGAVCTGGAVALSGVTSASVVTIGTQTTTIGGSNGNPYRSGNGNNNQVKTQLLVLASELSAAGIPAGAISSLGFTTTTSTGTIANFTIRMAHTSVSALTTTYQTPTWTTVFTQASFTPVPNITNVHTFSTPFVWDGTSNVLIETCQTNTAAQGTSTVAAHTPPFAANVHSASSTTACASATGTAVTARPNMTFGYASTYNWSWSDGTSTVATSASATVNPVNATSAPITVTYTATATNAATGCSRTHAAVVTVDPASVGGTTASDQSICIGNTPASISLTGNLGNVVKWQRSTDPTFATGTTDIVSTSTTLTGPVIGQLSQTTYFRAVVKSGACAEANSASVTVTVTSNITAGTALAASGACANYSVANANNYMSNCALIATIVPNGASPVAGNINACVTIDGSVQSAPNGVPYVQRHYNILPAANPTTATSRITLYFLQSEFDAFNTASGSLGMPLLPANTGDATGKANLRVTQFNTSAAGSPGTYPAGTGFVINPADIDIVFADGRWSVSFDVTGSGAFYVHTGNFVLPVAGLEFTGVQLGAVNKLTWRTVTETNNRGFELQRSADGVNFSSLLFIASKAENGNSASPLNYNYDDARPFAGSNYYRLKQVDKDGKFTYSNTVLLSRKVTEITLSSVYPNPTERELNLVITSPRSEKVTIIVTDLTGKVVMQYATQLVNGENQQRLEVLKLSAGTYIIKAVCANGCETAVHRFVKQ